MSTSLSKCKSCNGVGIGLVQSNGLCKHCSNNENSKFSAPSSKVVMAPSLPVCKGCGGFGVGLVQLSGFCSHCMRIGASSKKRPRGNNDEEEEEDAGNHSSRLQKSSPHLPTSRDNKLSPGEIQQLLEEADKANIASLDSAGVKRALLQLEKKISTNALLRAKHADDPSKVLNSEVELDAEIKGLCVLAAAPEQYDILIKSGSLTSILGLLSHENTDIVIDVVMLFTELLSEEALATANGEGEEDDIGAVAGDMLIKALMENGGFSSLIETCEYLDSSSKFTGDDDFGGLLSTLELIQTIVETSKDGAAIAKSLFTKAGGGDPSSRFAAFLLRKVNSSKSEYNDVKGAAAELLSTLLAMDVPLSHEMSSSLVNQCNASLLGSTVFEMNVKGQQVQVDGIEYLLEAASAFKKRNPISKDEEEFAENIFDALSSALALEPVNRTRFRDAEGFELMIRTIHENGFARFSALRTISHALAGSNSEIAETFIEAGGLKVVFPAFLGRSLAHTRKFHGPDAAEKEDEYAVSIIVSCFDHLLESSVSRLRVLNKFNELGGSTGSRLEKIDRLVELHALYYDKVEQVALSLEKDGFRKERLDEGEEEEKLAVLYMSRLRGGLQTLQKIDSLIAYLATNTIDVPLSLSLRAKLYEQGGSLLQVAEILSELEEKIDNAGDDAKREKEKIGSLLELISKMSE